MPRAGKDGRVLSRRISTSTTIADLGDPKTVTLATWIIPHCDDQGRLEAEPRKIKALVCPMLDWIDVEDVERALERMADLGYILLYQAPDGTPLLQLLSWWRWNSGQTWIYPSEWPAPPGWKDCLRYRSGGKTIEQQHSYHPPGVVPQCATLSNNVEQCETLSAAAGSVSPTPTTALSPSPGEGEHEGEGGRSPPIDPDDGTGAHRYGYTRDGKRYELSEYREVCALFEQEIQLLSGVIVDDVQWWFGEVSAAWIKDAIHEAARNNVRRWSYVEAILQAWRRDGRGPPKAGARGATGPPVNTPWTVIGKTEAEYDELIGRKGAADEWKRDHAITSN